MSKKCAEFSTNESGRRHCARFEDVDGDIAVAKTEVTPLGGGLYRIKADVENAGFLPTALAGSGSRQSFEWVIKAAPGTAVTLKAVAQKGGTDTATITLK